MNVISSLNDQFWCLGVEAAALESAHRAAVTVLAEAVENVAQSIQVITSSENESSGGSLSSMLLGVLGVVSSKTGGRYPWFLRFF